MRLFFNTLLFICGTLLARSLAAPTPYDADGHVAITRLQDFEDEAPSYNTTIESRQFAAAAGQAVTEIANAIGGLISDIKAGVSADNNNREAFTQNVVGELFNQNSNFNYVIVHVKHETKFDGVKDVDWGHSHEELDIKIGGTIGYEIYWFRSGTFIRKGDGGFINWAFIGRVTSKSRDGKTITFAAA